MALGGRPIVTAAEMRASEAQAIAGGETVDSLMARAGQGVADVVGQIAAGRPILILCGPGNNGGDGYVAARLLADRGCSVRLAASAEPRTDAARSARAVWPGPIEGVADAQPAEVLVDCLFGTGLGRALATDLAQALARLVERASDAIAVDVPSGLDSDTGSLLGPVPQFSHTLALGALKPGHLLQPGAARCGAIEIIDLNLDVAGRCRVIERPRLGAPPPEAHKYSRGMVAVIAGAMPGASLLAATAALRAGAGYGLVLGGNGGGALALVHRPFDEAALSDDRIGALVIGPGLGRDDQARDRLDQALAFSHTLLIDGDALHLATPRQIALRAGSTVLTPHAGEFGALFGGLPGSKIDAARAAASITGAVVVFKGADTVVAAPDGRVGVACAASSWLSTAGTGDVLAGAIAAMLAGGMTSFDAACAGAWLHGEAARRCEGAFIADDLAFALSAVRGSV